MRTQHRKDGSSHDKERYTQTGTGTDTQYVRVCQRIPEEGLHLHPAYRQSHAGHKRRQHLGYTKIPDDFIDERFRIVAQQSIPNVCKRQADRAQENICRYKKKQQEQQPNPFHITKIRYICAPTNTPYVLKKILLFLLTVCLGAPVLYGEEDKSPAPLDTLDTRDKFIKIVLFEDFTWKYIDLGKPVFDEEKMYEGWDSSGIHAFKDVPLEELPEEAVVILADSLTQAYVPTINKVRSVFFEG